MTARIRRVVQRLSPTGAVVAVIERKASAVMRVLPSAIRGCHQEAMTRILLHSLHVGGTRNKLLPFSPKIEVLRQLPLLPGVLLSVL